MLFEIFIRDLGKNFGGLFMKFMDNTHLDWVIKWHGSEIEFEISLKRLKLIDSFFTQMKIPSLVPVYMCERSNNDLKFSMNQQSNMNVYMCVCVHDRENYTILSLCINSLKKVHFLLATHLLMNTYNYIKLKRNFNNKERVWFNEL